MKRTVEALDGQKVEMHPAEQVGGKHRWGGRRHGLERGGGKAPKVSIVLSTDEYERLEMLRKVLARNMSVTNGTNQLAGDSSIKSTDGRLSRSDACRVAIRVLWETAVREGMVGESEKK